VPHLNVDIIPFAGEYEPFIAMAWLKNGGLVDGAVSREPKNLQTSETSTKRFLKYLKVGFSPRNR
jgi:hypothetical protein